MENVQIFFCTELFSVIIVSLPYISLEIILIDNNYSANYFNMPIKYCVRHTGKKEYHFNIVNKGASGAKYRWLAQA